MELSELLISLPASLNCLVLRDWLTLRSVVALDNAYCTKAHRERFVSLLRSNEYFIAEQLSISIIRVINLRKYGDKIRCVRLRYNLCEERAGAFLHHCSHLTHVHIDRMGVINPELWLSLAVNPNIECLEFTSDIGRTLNRLGPPFENVRLPKLQSLSFRNVTFKGSQHWLDAFQLNRNLLRLDLSDSMISQPILLHIPQFCPHLMALGLAQTRLSDEVLITISASCRNIVHLNIAENYMLTDDGVIGMLRNLKGLQSLCIEKVSALTDVSLQHIVTHCANSLHSLHFDNSEQEGEGPFFTEEGINTMLEGCRQLRVVYFRTFPARYESNLEFTPAAICNLKTLVLSGGVITSATLTCIATHAVNLRVLSIYEHEVDDYVYAQEGLKSLCFGCPQLSEIYLCIIRNKPYIQLVMELWQALKPTLLFKMCPPRNLEYCIIHSNE